MPILIEPEVDASLDQGDLLDELKLYWSDAAGDVHGDDGIGLVVSRPCVSIRRQIVQVAVVKSAKLDVGKLLSDNASLERIRRRMFAIRDGDGQPDVFYLGPLPGKSERVSARLDHIVSIEVPTDPTERAERVRARRIARLDDSFRRDLHVRMFTAIARQGFSDMGWYTDEDLELLVNHGRSLAGTARAEADAAKAQLQAAQADGDEKRAKGLKQKAANAEKKAVESKAEVTPYERELSRRQQESNEADGAKDEAPSFIRASSHE